MDHSIGSLEPLYAAAYDFPLSTGKPRLTYMLATTPRTGSTLLALDLLRSGRMGAPLEYCNPRYIHQYAGRLGAVTLGGYLEALQRVRTSPNGIFGVKLMRAHYDLLRSPSAEGRFTPDFVIRLQRRDRLAQAISLTRAMQTGSWVSGAPQTMEAQFDFDAIHRSITYLQGQEEAWDRLLSGMDIPILDIAYEDFVEDSPSHLSSIFRLAGVTDGNLPIADIPELKVQRDHETEIWYQRYLTLS